MNLTKGYVINDGIIHQQTGNNGVNTTIAQIVIQIKSGKLSAESLISEIFTAISKNTHLNAFISTDKSAAMAAAREIDEKVKQGNSTGDLAGIPFVVKDNIHVSGLPSTAGTLALKDFYPKKDSPVVAKLREAGAIIIGKTNMHELAFGITGFNSAFYDERIGVRNAYDDNKFAGGSSSGSAVALGAGLTIFALGTDTGGSVRIPAALNNAVGFRPTIGRYSQDAVAPISHTRDTIGPIANSVEDIVFLDKIITGLESSNSFSAIIRLGYDESQALANSTPEVKRNWQNIINTLSSAHNVELVKIELSEIYQLNSQISFPVALYEANEDMVGYLSNFNPGMSLEDLAQKIASPDVKDTYDNLVIPKKLPTPDGDLVEAQPIYQEAIQTHRPNLIAAYNNIFNSNKLSAIISPTTVSEALDAVSETTTLENFGLFIQNTDPTSNAGFPSISIPSGSTNTGLSLGLLIDGMPNKDSDLLSIAKDIEALLS